MVYKCLKPQANGDISRVNAYEALTLIQSLHMELLKLPANPAVQNISQKSIDTLMTCGHHMYNYMTVDPMRAEDCAFIMLQIGSVIALGMHGSRWSDDLEMSESNECDGQDDHFRQLERQKIEVDEMQIYASLHTWATSTWWDEVCTSDLAGACQESMYVLLDDEFTFSQKMACAMMLFSASNDLKVMSTITSPSTISLQSSTYIRELQKSGRITEQMNAIAEMSDSELGQQVIRDMITSFLIPRIEMFPRYTTLFNSEITKFIMENYPHIVRRAHMKATLTGPFLWHDLNEDELERTCVILAGIAVFLAPDIDSVRKKAAFNGRVDLPFVRSKRPSSGPLLQFSQQKWSCYIIEPNGSLTLQCSGEGMKGLERCALLFTHLYDSIKGESL